MNSSVLRSQIGENSSSAECAVLAAFPHIYLRRFRIPACVRMYLYVVHVLVLRQFACHPLAKQKYYFSNCSNLIFSWGIDTCVMARSDPRKYSLELSVRWSEKKP